MVLNRVHDDLSEFDAWIDEMNKITSIIGRGTPTSGYLDDRETFGLVMQCFFENGSSGLELRINEQFNQFLIDTDMSVRPSDYTTVKTNRKQGRINKVYNALAGGTEYLSKNVYPELEKITEKYECAYYLDFFKECVKGSYLIHIPEIRNFYVINQYSIAYSQEMFFGIAVKNDEIYGFSMDHNGFIRFGVFNKYHFCMMNLHRYNTKKFPMKIGDIVDEYDILTVEELSGIFENMMRR